ncbi:hypothetical protein HU200_066712 [Digitaria exilis]|uniref:Uncharacterized protein n=1 Tax=Digitaria exilis TaxID=1010633 RepID=A0A835DTJ8_9POAL|nr:hypothetical protein HU200_066712 [Digitaria exilis]
MEQASGSGPPPPPPPPPAAERDMGFAERAVSAAGAAVVSAILVNPLDVAKMWSDFRCYPSCSTGGINGFGPSCSPECFQYRGTMDVFSKVTRQVGIYLPTYDLLRNWIEEYSDHNCPKLRPYAPLISGSIARSLACITCSPIELARTRMQAFKESNAGGKPPGMWKTLLGVLSSRQNISSPENCFIAGVISAGATCPLDVAKTRRQIEASLGLWARL